MNQCGTRRIMGSFYGLYNVAKSATALS